MEIFVILFIAFALGLDAFSVSLAAGSYFGKANIHQKFRLSFHFGLFQFLMPVAGWFIGKEISNLIEDYDHWVALIIFIIIGGKMIFDSFQDNDEVKKDISRGWVMIILAVATSIDALAVGFSFGIIEKEIILPSIVIGIVAAIMSLTGIKIGEKIAGKSGKYASAIAGGVLIILGIKILVEHTLFTT